jgi:glycerophosphoryl diester phosphodiesterase
VIGHRGAPVLAPGNSLEGLQAAVAAGADLVEFDVGAGLVLGHRGEHPPSPPPRLGEALDALAPHEIGLHIDLKQVGIEADVAREVRERGLGERVVVSSTWARSLERLAAVAPELTRVIGYPRDRARASEIPWPAAVRTGSAAAARALMPLRLPRLLVRGAPGALSLHHALVSAPLAAQVHARGAALVAWTVNDPGCVLRLAELGVDAIVSDDPGMALGALGTLEAR